MAELSKYNKDGADGGGDGGQYKYRINNKC